MAEGFALNFAVSCALPALLSSCFLLTGLPAQQYLASGTNRFATSREVRKALDAERALPNNTDAKASGVALVRYGRPPKGGSLCLCGSHRTSGVARACTASLMKWLFYDSEGHYECGRMGYAVMATHYAGLATQGGHAYLDSSRGSS